MAAKEVALGLGQFLYYCTINAKLLCLPDNQTSIIFMLPNDHGSNCNLFPQTLRSIRQVSILNNSNTFQH